MVKELCEELRSEDANLNKMMDQFLNDPAACGLDLREDLLLAVSEQHGDIWVEIVAKMHNKNDYEKFLRNYYNGGQIREYESFSYVEDEGWIIAWDKKVAMLIGTDAEKYDMRAEADRLYKLEKGKSITSKKQFSEFWKNRGDVSLFVDLAGLLNIPDIRRELRDVPQSMFEGLDEAACFATLNFNKGNMELHLQSINCDNNSFKEILKQEFNEKILGYMPEKVLAAASFSVNMQVLIDLIKKADDDLLKEKIDDNYTLREILNCFNGSASGAISELKMEQYDLLPIYTITADMSNSSKIKQLINNMNLTEEKNGYYKLDDELYVAVINDVLILTNDIDMRRGNNKGLKNVADDAKTGFFAYADLDINHYPSSLTKDLSTDTRNFLKSLWSSCELKSNKENSVDITLSIPSGDKNSLAYTLKLFDTYLYKFDEMADNIDNMIDPRPAYNYEYEEMDW